MIVRVVVLLVALTFALAPAADAATNKQLRHQVSSLQRQVKVLKAQRDRLRTENGQLKGGVPDRVRAIAGEDNLDQLFQLVIVPALNASPCKGSLFYGQTFYGADFNRHTDDGGCY